MLLSSVLVLTTQHHHYGRQSIGTDAYVMPSLREPFCRSCGVESRRDARKASSTGIPRAKVHR